MWGGFILPATDFLFSPFSARGGFFFFFGNLSVSETLSGLL